MTRSSNSSRPAKPPAEAAILPVDLLAWYDEHKRDLPWRRTVDPYAIWVSEIMLQQTRVETVMPYYERFLERFPSVEALASADTETVLAIWSGLGYYRRARNLHRAAQAVVDSGNGIPTDSRTLMQLPGIGSYTAAAVASIAFGEAVPAIDGNIERVITRWRGIGGNPRRGEGRRMVVLAASWLIDRGRPGDSNQALMELGATLCRPRQPRCEECPLAPDCVAASSGHPEVYPSPRERPSPVRVERWVAVIRNGDEVLLIRRQDGSGPLPGMWTLPWVDRTPEGTAADRFAQRYGGLWWTGRALGEVRHAITRRQFHIEILEAWQKDGGDIAEGTEAGWFDRQEVGNLPKSSLVDKVLTKIGFLVA
jgi:A/G-specific adenine glycosylase